MTTSHDHFYGDEPECALCGHYGPDSDPKPCIPRHEVGKVVHGLRRRLAVAYTKSEGEALVALTNAILADEAKLKARIDELLTANNVYLEEGRAARRALAEAKAVNAVLARQLVTLREALEFYADEDGYKLVEVDAAYNECSPVQKDLGVIAEQALQDVFGAERPPLEPKKEPEP